MQRIIVIPDSFKGALSSREAGSAIAAGLASVTDAEVLVVPIADGGEGTVEAFVAAAGGALRSATVCGVFYGERVPVHYGLIDPDVAVVETASCAGLPLASGREDTGRATTFGVGEQILDAVSASARRVIVGAGGSATTDGGTGAAAALGVRFLDAAGEEFVPTGDTLTRIARIDSTPARDRLRAVDVEVMCDISNPLTGSQGAAHVFGPQKGADPASVVSLDTGLVHLAGIVERDLGVAIDALPGAGAAGGLAGGLHAFIGATLKPGIDVVLKTAGFHDLVKTADLVITGEGRIDGQSLAGKVPIGVAQAVRAAGRAIPVIVLAGSVGQDADTLYDEGITAIVPIGRGPQDLATAIRRTAEDLTATARDVGRLVMACSPAGLTR